MRLSALMCDECMIELILAMTSDFKPAKPLRSLMSDRNADFSPSADRR